MRYANGSFDGRGCVILGLKVYTYVRNSGHGGLHYAIFGFCVLMDDSSYCLVMGFWV